MEIDLAAFDQTIGAEPLDWTEVERAHTPEEDGRVPHVPFGFNHANWEEFKARMTETTELRAYSSEPEDWARCMGQEGYVLIDEGKIIAAIMTRMN